MTKPIKQKRTNYWWVLLKCGEKHAYEARRFDEPFVKFLVAENWLDPAHIFRSAKSAIKLSKKLNQEPL